MTWNIKCKRSFMYAQSRGPESRIILIAQVAGNVSAQFGGEN